MLQVETVQGPGRWLHAGRAPLRARRVRDGRRQPLRNRFQVLDSVVLAGAALVLAAVAVIGFERRDVGV